MGDQPEVVMSNGGSPPRLSTVSVPRLSIAFGRRGSGPAVRRGQTGVAEGLIFKNVCLNIGTKRIVRDVSGHASPGHLLAVMGPSGSGKTTLLSALAGHLPLTSGTVTLNGVKLSKKMKRQISFVLQSDIFFPNLTLRETLQYSAMLRLPREFTFREKLAKVEEIIEALRLTDCADTIIGNVEFRGLSGGEKKRVNVACELLTNPSTLFLDEPTSGLDSSSALILMETLSELAKAEGKIIVASIHQPSSRLYHMFDSLLLLAKGKTAYFGAASQVLNYFEHRGLHCILHYNPADFILEMVTQKESRELLVGEDPIDEVDVSSVWWKKIFFWRKPSKAVECDDEKHDEIEEYPASPKFPRMVVPSDDEDRKISDVVKVSQAVPSMADSESTCSSEWGSERKWPTPWHWQLLVLIVRTFRQSRHILLSKLNFLQTILLTIIVSIVWFQIPRDERSIADRYGYFFFTVIFWSFQPLIVATLSLPSEHVIISKERQSGCYHLSAYYLAKTLSELPLLFLLPSIFIIISYWCTGINGWATFFGVWFIQLITSIVAQGMGFMIGALFMNVSRSLVAVTIIMLSLMLVGGFYVQRLPYWFTWFQYLSYISFSYDSMLQLAFMDLTLSCGESGMSRYDACSFSSNQTVNNATISGDEVLALSNFSRTSFAWYWNLLFLAFYLVLFRVVAYLALRFLHKKNIT